ncbi:MAG TPA: nuclear transport factor 2 family protein [Flavisolibacter sp.]|jgi:hypothetical protein|nr:nuclear transport factor 2 family protein [Flavisolibacter sp.]
MRTNFSLLLIALLVSITGIVSAQGTKQGLPPYTPESRELHDTIARMDSLFFDAYNTCKMDVMENLISDEVEFYHDRGGLSTSKKDLLTSLKNNICGKVTRSLLPGSIEVYPIPKFGAVQMGAHRFHNNQEPADAPFRYSKFVHTWRKEGTQWRLYRVISLH